VFRHSRGRVYKVEHTLETDGEELNVRLGRESDKKYFVLRVERNVKMDMRHDEKVLVDLTEFAEYDKSLINGHLATDMLSMLSSLLL
jgi:hypothetical protein